MVMITEWRRPTDNCKCVCMCVGRSGHEINLVPWLANMYWYTIYIHEMFDVCINVPGIRLRHATIIE